jgi:toxin ParE1/3/4
MIVRFHPKALEELSETASYYSEISENLANQFLLEHGRTQIVDFPVAWPPAPGNTRRYLLPGFPYQIVYRMNVSEIQIIAVAHYKRKPRYWRRRLRGK